jgi:hypothetical protein
MLSTWRMPSSGMLRLVALVRIDVSEERIVSFIRVTRIGGLLLSPWWWRRYVPPTRRFLREPLATGQLLLTFFLDHRFFSSSSWGRYVRPKRRFLQGPHNVTSQKTAFSYSSPCKPEGLHSINRLSSVAEMWCVSCEVRTGFLYPRRQQHSSYSPPWKPQLLHAQYLIRRCRELWQLFCTSQLIY